MDSIEVELSILCELADRVRVVESREELSWVIDYNEAAGIQSSDLMSQQISSLLVYIVRYHYTASV